MIDGYSGLQTLYKRDALAIIRTGCNRLRQFSPYNGFDSISLEATHHSIELSERDLVIAKNQLKKLSVGSNTAEGLYLLNEGRHVTKGAREWHFSDMQASIIKALHDVCKSDNPWLNGKKLLHEIGSQTFRMKDIFKHQSNWRDLIESNGRGYYRLIIE